MTRVVCERRDCKHWVDGECSKKEIEVKERAIPPEEEVAVCSTYEILAGYCQIYPKNVNARINTCFARENLMLQKQANQSFQEATAIAEHTLKTILKVAVKIEEQSYSLYTTAQERVKTPSSKKFLQELAQEEQKHKEKLLAIIENEERISELGSHTRNIQDLKIVDVTEDTTLSEHADYQGILIYAAKREKSTYEYYNSLALGLEGTEVGELFSRLAQEELTHKNKLEREYDEYVLTEN